MARASSGSEKTCKANVKRSRNGERKKTGRAFFACKSLSSSPFGIGRFGPTCIGTNMKWQFIRNFVETIFFHVFNHRWPESERENAGWCLVCCILRWLYILVYSTARRPYTICQSTAQSRSNRPIEWRTNNCSCLSERKNIQLQSKDVWMWWALEHSAVLGIVQI